MGRSGRVSRSRILLFDALILRVERRNTLRPTIHSFSAPGRVRQRAWGPRTAGARDGGHAAEARRVAVVESARCAGSRRVFAWVQKLSQVRIRTRRASPSQQWMARQVRAVPCMSCADLIHGHSFNGWCIVDFFVLDDSRY